MEKDNSRKQDFVGQLKRREQVQFARMFADVFKSNFNAFQRGDQTRSLVISDFWQFSNRGELEIVIPGEIFNKIDYSVVYVRLLKEIERTRATNSFESGIFKLMPQIKSPAIDDFKSENHGVKLDCEYMRFDLKTKTGEAERYVLRERFINPKTRKPITEIWTGFVVV